jgi:hypothetical protein
MHFDSFAFLLQDWQLPVSHYAASCPFFCPRAESSRGASCEENLCLATVSSARQARVVKPDWATRGATEAVAQCCDCWLGNRSREGVASGNRAVAGVTSHSIPGYFVSAW